MSTLPHLSALDSITEGRRALGHFVNRDAAIERFRILLDDDPPQNQILFFHGEGGNGKSLLLRLLHEYGCHRSYRPKGATAASSPAERTTAVPSAFVDFARNTTKDHRPHDALYGPLLLRHALGTHGFAFPLYDYALLLYLRKTNQLTSTQLHALFPPEALRMVATLLDATRGGMWGQIANAALSMFNPH